MYSFFELLAVYNSFFNFGLEFIYFEKSSRFFLMDMRSWRHSSWGLYLNLWLDNNIGKLGHLIRMPLILATISTFIILTCV